MKYLYKSIVFITVISLALMAATIYTATKILRKVLHERQTRR